MNWKSKLREDLRYKAMYAEKHATPLIVLLRSLQSVRAFYAELITETVIEASPWRWGEAESLQDLVHSAEWVEGFQFTDWAIRWLCE